MTLGDSAHLARTWESIAVVKRRGCDIWPCTPGFGGPVCRVGGKLHGRGPLMSGSQGAGPWRDCAAESGPSGLVPK